MKNRGDVSINLEFFENSEIVLMVDKIRQDGAVPPGFQQEIEALATAIEGGTARETPKRQARQKGLRNSATNEGTKPAGASSHSPSS